MDNPQRKRKHDMDYKKSNFFKKPNRNYLVAGQRGFLATCNFREKECARECIKILSQYADNLYGKEDFKKIGQQHTSNKTTDESQKSPTNNDKEKEEEDEDISTTLQKEINATVTAHKQKLTRFQQLDTGASNSIFIRTTLSDPVELGANIVRDIAATKQHQSRFVLRLIPIEIVCKANMKDILNEAGKLFDKHFLNCSATTFSIMFNRRYNNDLGRDAIIGELADLIKFKNMHHKVDLTAPAFTVIVEIIKGLCCLSVVPQYLALKKYNLFELSVNKDETAIVSHIKKDDNDAKKKNDDAKDDKTDDGNVETLEEENGGSEKEKNVSEESSKIDENEVKSSND